MSVAERGRPSPIALGLAVLLAAVGCSRGEPVAVLGDSITALDAADLEERVGDDHALVISADFGRTTSEAMAEAEDLAAQHDVEQVIINLGTNDVLREVPTADSVSALGDLVALFGRARCIHLVNVNEHMAEQSTGQPRTDGAVALNAGIAGLAATDPRLSVLDWAAVTGATLDGGDPPRSTLTSDSIHPTREGNARLNELYAGALGSCPRAGEEDGQGRSVAGTPEPSTS